MANLGPSGGDKLSFRLYFSQPHSPCIHSITLLMVDHGALWPDHFLSHLPVWMGIFPITYYTFFFFFFFCSGPQESQEILFLVFLVDSVHKSHVQFCKSMDCSLPGSSLMAFSRQTYWSGLPFPSPRDLPDPGVEFRFPSLQTVFLLTELSGKPTKLNNK